MLIIIITIFNYILIIKRNYYIFISIILIKKKLK